MMDSPFQSFIKKLRLNFKYAFTPNKPLLVLRLIFTFVKILLFKKQPLRYVDFAIDYECNLSCEHCFKTALEKKNVKGRERRMEVDDYRKTAEACMRLGAVNFSFQGGELFLFKDWERVIQACKPKKNVISVTTNGTMLTDKVLNKLKNNGVDILTISLDSAIPEEHDSFRGVPGTHKKVMAGLNRALEKGFRLTIGTVVSNQNLHSPGIQGLIEFAEKKEIILNLILAVPAGNWQDKPSILFKEEDLQYIVSLTRSSPFIRTDFDANFIHRGCGAMKEILYITPYGDVLPCPFIHITFGNILQEPVETIWKRGIENPFLKNYEQKCLAAEDREFIDKYLSQTFGEKDLPLRWDSVFKK